MMSSASRSAVSLRQQRGAASVAIAMLILFILAAAVTAVMNMSGSSVIDAAKSEEQVSALFLAESGLERGQGMLKSASDPAVSGACTSITGSGFTVGSRGTFNLSATATCDTAVPPVCSICKITSTGIIGSTSRTVVRVVSVAAPSGGATGCGGGGITPVACPSGISPAPPAADIYKDIVQAIEVTTPPAVLISNMAYLRHPAGGANNVNAAAACVTLTPADIACVTEWHDESNTSSGSGVVGSRGASGLVTTVMGPGTYKLTQNLTADSLFAAVGAKFGASGALSIVGSYWSDSGATGVTARNNATATGSTNDGAACPLPLGNATCPNATTAPLAIPDPPSAGSAQTSRSWCYDADTLVFGFSGKSSNNSIGALTGFSFNGQPSLVPVGNSTAAYPKAPANSELYAALRYIYNPSYEPDSSSTASTGEVIGAIGATVTGAIGTTIEADTSNNNPITVNSYTSGGSTGLSIGDEITSTACNRVVVGAVVTAIGAGTVTINPAPTGNCNNKLIGFNGNKLFVSNATGSGPLEVGAVLSGAVSANTTILSFVSPANGYEGSYNLAVIGNAATKQGPTGNVTITTSATKLKVATVTTGPLYTNDLIFGTGVANLTTISGTTTGAAGETLYVLSEAPQNVAPNTIIKTSTVTLTAGTTAPTGSPIIAVRAGTGTFATGTTVSTVTSATQFKVSAVPTVSLFGAKICGGICAFFNHTSVGATTPFTLTMTNTSQWAAGLTCLKGVNKDDIVGLTGTGAAVAATTWYEPVR